LNKKISKNNSQNNIYRQDAEQYRPNRWTHSTLLPQGSPYVFCGAWTLL